MLISENKTERRVVMLLAFSALAFFFFVSNPFAFYFLNDDFVHIPLAAAGNFFHSNLLRPVADCTLWLDSLIWGKQAPGFHVTNIVIHLVNAGLVYSLISKMLQDTRRRHASATAWLAALFFLVYAFHSESVFWIIGRGGSLAALCILVSLNCYASSKSTMSLVVALVSFVTGLFVYEFVWVLPVIILFFQCRDLYQKKTVFWRWSLSFGIVFIGYLAVRLKIDTVYFSDYETGSLRTLRISRLITNYLATVVRCFLPPVKSSVVFVTFTILLWVAATTIVAYLIMKRNRRIKFLIFPFLCLLVSCLPSISLGIDTHDTEGERFLYVPSVFFCWFIVELVFVLISSVRTRLALFMALLSIHCYYLYQSSVAYRYAGAVVRQSLECISGSDAADTLSADAAPSQYRGALIFRSGFSNAVEWTMPGKFKAVVARSGPELQRIVYFHCVNRVQSPHSHRINVSWGEDGQIYFSDAIR